MNSGMGKTVVVGLVVLVALFIGLNYFSGPTEQSVEVTFPGGSALRLDASQPEIAHDQLLEEIFADTFMRDGLMGWLVDKDIFSFKDARLVEALNERLCGSIPEEPLDQKIKASQDCAALPVAAALRQLVDQRQVPFHYVGISVQVGIPAREDQPGLGRAHACDDSEFRGKRVELTNPRTSNQIEVQVSGTYRCTGFQINMFPNIQLGSEDAQELFPGPFQKFQEAIAVALN